MYLIEDDDDLAKALETLLTEENYICLRYRTAESFIEESANLAGDFNFQIHSNTPNCCLIDVRLTYVRYKPIQQVNHAEWQETLTDNLSYRSR